MRYADMMCAEYKAARDRSSFEGMAFARIRIMREIEECERQISHNKPPYPPASERSERVGS